MTLVTESYFYLAAVGAPESKDITFNIATSDPQFTAFFVTLLGMKYKEFEPAERENFYRLGRDIFERARIESGYAAHAAEVLEDLTAYANDRLRAVSRMVICGAADGTDLQTAVLQNYAFPSNYGLIDANGYYAQYDFVTGKLKTSLIDADEFEEDTDELVRQGADPDKISKIAFMRMVSKTKYGPAEYTASQEHTVYGHMDAAGYFVPFVSLLDYSYQNPQTE